MTSNGNVRAFLLPSHHKISNIGNVNELPNDAVIVLNFSDSERHMGERTRHTYRYLWRQGSN